jgi:opacity protein-like surface antigen
MIFIRDTLRRGPSRCAPPLCNGSHRSQRHARTLRRRYLAAVFGLGLSIVCAASSFAQENASIAPVTLGLSVPTVEVVQPPPATQTSSSGWQGPGGRHEFGAWWGFSGISGHVWGFAGDVKYMPMGLRYSYEFMRHRQDWTLRYSPELTALARIDWLQPDSVNNVVTSQSPRMRTYGSGFSPVGLRWGFRSLSTVQPFFSTNAGFLYFADRVLSPQGSQWMYTIDFGAGFNVFHHSRQAVTVGYRYQHLSNANISSHNPGTDANTFYVGVSRFRNKGE